MGESLSLAGVARGLVIIGPPVPVFTHGKDRLLVEGRALRLRDRLGRHGRKITTALGGRAARVFWGSIQGVFLIQATAEGPNLETIVILGELKKMSVWGA